MTRTLYTLIEPCCGSAALSLHLLGARRPLLPYQGGKWRVRTALTSLLAEVGARGVPRRVALYDVSTWGTAAAAVIEPTSRAGIIDRLDFFARLDARLVYDALHNQPVPEDPVERSAQFLFLQRLAYSGKAVGIRKGRWSSPGFNSSSAYGVAGTERFGDVSPMIPSLIATLRSYASLVAPERLTTGPTPPPGEPCPELTVVYIDPPYDSTTDYPDGKLDRGAVISLALAWADAGACVMVSEASALGPLLDAGWSARQLYVGRADTSLFRGKQQEWVTLSPQWSAPR